MPETVLAEWRRTVAQYPANPLRVILAENEARLKNGRPDTIAYTLWFAGDKLWRTAVDQSNLDVKYDDKGMDGRTSWSLNSRNMELADAGAEPQGPIGGQLAIGYVRRFVSQGLVPYLGPGVALTNFRSSATGATWRATFDLPDGAQATIQGEWRDAGVIREIDVRKPGERQPKLRILVSGVEHDEVLGVVRAKALEVSLPTSDVRTEWVVTAPVERREVSLRAAPPDPTGADPVRGAVTVVQVNDLRQASREVRFKEGEQWRTITASQATIDYVKLRVAGWVLAAVIMVILVGLRIRSTRTSSIAK